MKHNTEPDYTMGDTVTVLLQDEVTCRATLIYTSKKYLLAFNEDTRTLYIKHARKLLWEVVAPPLDEVDERQWISTRFPPEGKLVEARRLRGVTDDEHEIIRVRFYSRTFSRPFWAAENKEDYYREDWFDDWRFLDRSSYYPVFSFQSREDWLRARIKAIALHVERCQVQGAPVDDVIYAELQDHLATLQRISKVES